MRELNLSQKYLEFKWSNKALHWTRIPLCSIPASEFKSLGGIARTILQRGGKIIPRASWCGKLSPLMSAMVNANNAPAWIVGNARDTVSMKQHMKRGYEVDCSDHVTRYDDLGLEHYIKIANSRDTILNY